ncbi:urease accessory protein [Flectobacillus major]|uniref:urease accessory protein n=1 Tax=Flectobacillus major TaxID=103 RepID=UPI000429FC53|nr:urease accessory protein [Flectobacillus major]
MEIAPLLLASIVGFSHAFEADHLVAVSNIVTRRNSLHLAMKDGVYWGLGHTSTILLVGCVFILGKFTFHENSFHYLEAAVGIMLIILGVFRLFKLYTAKATVHTHASDVHEHKLAYGVGLVHGLAGSGALVLSVLTTIKGIVSSLLYLFIFGIGSIGGMMLAAGIFSVPFSEKIIRNQKIRVYMTLLSSLFCIGLGVIVIHQQLK